MTPTNADPPEIAEPARRRVQRVQLGHGVDEGEADAPADVTVRAHGRRNRVSHDLAAPALHHEEVGAEHGRVATEDVRTRCPVEMSPEPRQHLVLAPHVMGSGRDVAQGRPAQHQLMGADAKEIGQVR